MESMDSDSKHQSMPGQEPDADSIKLFIGQIPKDMSEEELRSMFEEYGPIYQLTKVKDKTTNEQKGCAFVTFFKRQNALDAQANLHGKKSYPGLKGPMQVKPANSELANEEEKKLFIGMIPKSMTDKELLEVMLPYGAVESCVILKDKDWQSKGQSYGCAFVTYATRKSAANAIKALHHVKTIEGAGGPMVVKIAETQKEKEMKKRGSSGTGAYSNMLAQQAYGLQSAMTNPTLQNLGTAISAIAADPLLSSIFNPNMSMVQQLATQMTPTSSAAAGGTSSAVASAYSSANNGYASQLNGSQQLPNNQTFGVYNQQGSAQVYNWKNPGMEDCNLFIFNIPEEFKDLDLMRLFCSYGNVVSCRVYYDKRTGKSKGFGFVSYDNSSSCKTAIQAMNGAHVGNRRIKVELKKPRAEGKPY